MHTAYWTACWAVSHPLCHLFWLWFFSQRRKNHSFVDREPITQSYGEARIHAAEGGEIQAIHGILTPGTSQELCRVRVIEVLLDEKTASALGVGAPLTSDTGNHRQRVCANHSFHRFLCQDYALLKSKSRVPFIAASPELSAVYWFDNNFRSTCFGQKWSCFKSKVVLMKSEDVSWWPHLNCCHKELSSWGERVRAYQ